ncbi:MULTISPECIES: SH3 domain-containing C40 family peptidase [unclassified Helicobacter]|uniref:SH3 domain-containing C40 family peptidase n=1 Tax=unclassified Helicobacter TaxID=2593540 RepID=UPI000CF17766|nr:MULTISPECIES: SH3 domain-containing C40 family peptidase [unclassified Helicobacter]
MRLLITLIVAIFLVGCSTTKLMVADLKLPQDANFYLQNNDFSLEFSQEISLKLKQHYLDVWFSPWKKPIPNPNASEVFWVAPSLLKNPGFGPNLKLYTQEEMKDLYDSMNMEKYPSVAIKAIVVSDTAVRATPTHLPRFKSRNNYPFDRWQNSLIFQGTPVLITHYNLAKDWAHIQSSFVYGWVRVENLAKITPEDERLFYQIKDYALSNKDNFPIYGRDDEFLSKGRTGKLFSIKKIDEKDMEIYLPYKKADGFMGLKTTRIKKDDFSLFPKKIDALSMANVINAMIGQFYGWGGELGSRDCSAFIRDSFANFGIYLPRNSAAQVRYAGNMIDLSKYSAKEKEKVIIENATPFATVIWLKGHIVLYIGTYEGRAIVAHSAWSVMTRNTFSKTENLLGGVVITTLTPETNKNGVFVKSKTLLDQVLGMSDLYQYALTF